MQVLEVAPSLVTTKMMHYIVGLQETATAMSLQSLLVQVGHYVINSQHL